MGQRFGWGTAGRCAWRPTRGKSQPPAPGPRELRPSLPTGEAPGPRGWARQQRSRMACPGGRRGAFLEEVALVWSLKSTSVEEAGEEETRGHLGLVFGTSSGSRWPKRRAHVRGGGEGEAAGQEVRWELGLDGPFISTGLLGSQEWGSDLRPRTLPLVSGGET